MVLGKFAKDNFTKAKERDNMLNKKFNHKHWFKDSNITVKDFLDYVIAYNGDFFIKIKMKSKGNILFSDLEKIYYLADNRYTYKLNLEESKYLSDNNEWFKKELLR